MLATGAAIEVNRTVDRDGYVGPGGTEVCWTLRSRGNASPCVSLVP
jgi:hypothetical protein